MDINKFEQKKQQPDSCPIALGCPTLDRPAIQTILSLYVCGKQ